MGKKGERFTNEANDAMQGFVRQIETLGGITSRKMFGGYGVFESGTMFALVDSQGGLFLKAGDANRARFEQAGAVRHGKMPYYLIPNLVLNDASRLSSWVQEAIKISKAGKK